MLLAEQSGKDVVVKTDKNGEISFELVDGPLPPGSVAPKVVGVSSLDMAKNLVQTTKQALFNGKVSAEIREERYNTCKACPFFIENSKRCSECGCFMEAKTWVGGDPNSLCPKQKWSR